MKKFLFLLMAVFLLFSFSNAFAEVSINFDSYSPGSILNQDGWIINGSACDLYYPSTASFSRGANTSNMLNVNYASLYRPWIQPNLVRIFSEATSADDTFSVWLYPQAINTNCRISFGLYLNLSFIEICSTSTGVGTLYTGSASCANKLPTNKVADFYVGKWYFVEINANWLTHTARMRVNGGAWHATYLNYPTATKFGNVGLSYMYNNQQWYVDDIHVAPQGTYLYTPQLSIAVEPLAGGSVTGSGIDCGEGTTGVCQEDYTSQEEVVLTANPASGYAFSHWREEESQIVDNPYLGSMVADKSLTAVFKPAFAFPLAGYTPYTAPVSSVFDHSGTAQYNDSDHNVTTFNGEASDNQTAYDGTTCYSKADNSAFGSGFNYVGYGSAGEHYLCYNGHPGLDYAVPLGTAIYAPADGIAHLPTSFPGVNNAQSYATVEIDHPNGYKTYYLHLSSQNVTENQPVYKGQTIIGHVGHTVPQGEPSVGDHLHFEIQTNTQNGWVPVDPYGWTGGGVDPYARATNITLWE